MIERRRGRGKKKGSSRRECFFCIFFIEGASDCAGETCAVFSVPLQREVQHDRRKKGEKNEKRKTEVEVVTTKRRNASKRSKNRRFVSPLDARSPAHVTCASFAHESTSAA